MFTKILRKLEKKIAKNNMGHCGGSESSGHCN